MKSVVVICLFYYIATGCIALNSGSSESKAAKYIESKFRNGIARIGCNKSISEDLRLYSVLTNYDCEKCNFLWFLCLNYKGLSVGGVTEYVESKPFWSKDIHFKIRVSHPAWFFIYVCPESAISKCHCSTDGLEFGGRRVFYRGSSNICMCGYSNARESNIYVRCEATADDDDASQARDAIGSVLSGLSSLALEQEPVFKFRSPFYRRFPDILKKQQKSPRKLIEKANTRKDLGELGCSANTHVCVNHDVCTQCPTSNLKYTSVVDGSGELHSDIGEISQLFY